MRTISFKVTDDEARMIRSRARKEGVSVSEYLRRRANSEAPAPQKQRQVRCRHTGAMIFAAPEDQKPLTTEAVRELLSDFP
jgi:mobilization protein NikA